MENESGPNPEERSAVLQAMLQNRSEIYRFAKEFGEQYYFEIHDRLIAFARYLQETYPDSDERLVFHALIGSGPNPERKYSPEDFPGEDSVAKFLEGLLEEVRGKKPEA